MSLHGHQPDIYQRYVVLARVARALATALGSDGPVALLDVGCGPEPLTSKFLGPGFAISRADVDTFGKDDIVRIVPGEPLPFESGSFPIVIAVDTLEHVPRDARPQFIAECARVASGAVVMCCPQGLAAVRRAEDLFQEITKTLSGGTGLEFLDEHRELGLPTREAIVPLFERAMSEVLVFPNAPLDDWIVYSTFDMAYACDFGDGPEKARFNEAINARLPLTTRDDASYRLFFIGTRTSEAAEAVRAALDAVARETAATARDAPLALAEDIARFRGDLRARAAADLKGVHDADRAHIDNLEAVVRGLREALGLKDRRIAELQAGLSAQTRRPPNRRTEIASLQGAIRVMRDAIDANDRSIEQLTTSPATKGRRSLRSRARHAAARRTVMHSGLFDPAYYVSQTPSAAESRDPLGHFLSQVGASAGPPHPLFDPAFYVSLYPELVAVNPLVHWIRFGAAERRRPHPLIDLDDYLARNPDLAAPGIDPLAHYVRLGAGEGRRLTLLFDPTFYLQQNPDVAAAAIDPLIHYLSHGWREGRRPNPFFDPEFYLAKNADVRDAGLEPLSHFAWAGAREGRRPSEEFDPKSYLAANPDVADAGINPLVHYLQFGRAEGRELALRRKAPAATQTFVPPAGLLPWFNPLRIELAERLEHEPAVNVLLPGLAMRHMSGGPNTAIQLACRLAADGVRTRLIATDAPLDDDPEPFWKHIVGLAGFGERPRCLEIVGAHDRDIPLVIGQNDLFLATAWWTAQMAKYACRHTRHARFLYLIQDYEPLLHAASTAQTLAEETYGLDYVPIVNSSMLLEYLRTRRIGRFADDAFAERALAFEPAVDRTYFYPEAADHSRPRRLLFYTRPNNGLRNLFELGVAALMKAAADGAFEDDPWEILGIGETFTPVPIGNGLTLTPAPWREFAGYAAQMRQSDVMLSLMLSPHPSYPPLEMAACGGRVVTTTFGTKTAARLTELSPNILGASPTIEGIAGAIVDAVAEARRGGPTADRLNLPSTWEQSLGPVVSGLRAAFFDWWDVPQAARAGEPKAWPATAYEVERFETLAARDLELMDAPEPGLLSFLTPVWNTEPGMLRDLAATLLAEASDARYEWVLLDNGSTRPETLAVLAEIAEHPAVRVQRSEENLGIIAGLRRLLEVARNRYAAFVDHDDLVTADCARVLSRAIRRRGYPALMYSDEDTLRDRTFLRPYRKPEWDPVLFANSCYTAHLSIVDRQRALSLGACTDPATEGSHDWDTFTRFLLAGHRPVHVPEVIYSWRMHAASTAAGIAAKPYVLDSQRAVLRRFLEGRGAQQAFDIVESPIIGSQGDWWLRRKPDGAHGMLSVIMGPDAGGSKNPTAGTDAIALDPGAPQLQQLVAAARTCAESGRLLHLLWGGLTISHDAWTTEATGLFELFPDTVMVGGRVCQGDRVIAGAGYFDRRGWESPDVGRRPDDPGYFSHALKPHSPDTVPVWHAVVRPRFLLRALEAITGIEVHYATLAAWLGAWARRTGGSVVYSPFLEATAPAGVVLPTDSEGKALFESVNADLFSRQPPRAATACSTDERTQPARELLPCYGAWLAARERVRHVHTPAEHAATLSLLTTVYERTDGALLEQLADSVLPQLTDRDEWLILAHGPIEPMTRQVLDRVGKHARVRLLEQPVNLGIAGGMRVCLEAARGDCVCPVDADDLLTTDALASIRQAFALSPAVLVYSDEDFLVDGRPRAPYARPDFDPVLDFESSWVWHLCAFERRAALDAGVYSDAGANYCHDWDTIGRLAATGRPIAHVREVLYHWRQHDASHTNNATVHPGSAASVRHVLERRRAALAHPDRFEVRPFPVFRGIEEPYLARVAGDAPRFGWVRVVPPGGVGRSNAVDEGSLTVSAASLSAGPALTRRLAEQLDRWPDAALIALTDAAVVPQPGWLQESLRLRELHEQVAICTGRVARTGDRVVAGPRVLDAAGHACDELAGMPVNDPGPFALALKPHQAALACPHLLVADAGWLRQVLDETPDTIEWGDLPTWLSAAAWKGGRWVVYSPLIAGGTTSALPSFSDGPASRAAVAQLRDVLGNRVMGLAGAQRLHSLVRHC